VKKAHRMKNNNF